VAVGAFRSGYPLAALFPGVDVPDDDRAGTAANSLGVLQYFIGISAAGLWDYTGLFVNTFLRGGLHWLHAWMATGQLKRADQIIAVPAWTANLLVVVGCVWAYTRLTKSWGDVGRFLAAFALTTGFFAADMALFQPRYLPLFRGMLHPHWP